MAKKRPSPVWITLEKELMPVKMVAHWVLSSAIFSLAEGGVAMGEWLAARVTPD